MNYSLGTLCQVSDTEVEPVLMTTLESLLRVQQIGAGALPSVRI
jgi:hypothetical protein